MLASLRATLLNGTTVDADATLVAPPGANAGIFLYVRPAGTAFPTLGQIGASVFKDEIGDNAQRLTWISVDGAPAGTTYLDYWVGVASPGDALANMPMATVKRRIDLAAGQTRGEGLLIPGPNYALFLDSDADGTSSTTVSFDVVAESSAVAQSLRTDPSSAGFGPNVETEADGDGMPWALATLSAAGALSLGLRQMYAASSAYAITIPTGADNDEFGVIETSGGLNNVTLTPSGGQLIENLVGVLGATAVINVANISITYKYDEAATAWRIIETNGHELKQVVLQPAVDAAVALTMTTGGVQLRVNSATVTVISTTSSFPGQKVNFFALSVAGGGSYTLVLDANTLTINATSEAPVVQRNAANTAWVCVGLDGATIV